MSTVNQDNETINYVVFSKILTQIVLKNCKCLLDNYKNKTDMNSVA